VTKQIPNDAYITLAFLEELIKYDGSAREVIS